MNRDFLKHLEPEGLPVFASHMTLCWDTPSALSQVLYHSVCAFYLHRASDLLRGESLGFCHDFPEHVQALCMYVAIRFLVMCWNIFQSCLCTSHSHLFLVSFLVCLLLFAPTAIHCFRQLQFLANVCDCFLPTSWVWDRASLYRVSSKSNQIQTSLRMGSPGKHQSAQMTILWKWGIEGTLTHSAPPVVVRVLVFTTTAGFGFQGCHRVDVGWVGIAQVKSPQRFSQFSWINATGLPQALG